MLIPQVVGVKLTGRLREGATATDLVLTVTEMFRKHGVVGKFVEYFGPGLHELPLADRATIGNMSPEYGATCGIFPVDKETLTYLRLTGRSEEQIALVEAYCREQGLFHDAKTSEAQYSELLALDLGFSRAEHRWSEASSGPGALSRRVILSSVVPTLLKPNPARQFPHKLPTPLRSGRWEQEGGSPTAVGVGDRHSVPASSGSNGNLHHGSVVIAAITSCTNTSNPSVMIAAGLLAKKAVERDSKYPVG